LIFCWISCCSLIEACGEELLPPHDASAKADKHSAAALRDVRSVGLFN
jgi:hypothetical protein